MAEVFNQMGLIEAWGTGIRNICKATREYHLPEPEFIEMTGTFRVNIYRQFAPMVDYVNESNSLEKYRNNAKKSLEKNGRSIGETSKKHHVIHGEN